MSHLDLPEDWERHPVSDPHRAADVLDLFVTTDLRRSGAVYVLLCDREDRVLQACAVETLPLGWQDGGRERFFAPFAEILTRLTTGGSLLVAVTRSDFLSIRSSDERWQSAAYAVCAAAGVRLLGVHLLTVHGSRVLPPVEWTTGGSRTA